MRNTALNYVKRENSCQCYFLNEGLFWHLCTPGDVQEIIFRNEDDFKYGMTASALSLNDVNESGARIRLYAFALMSNHVHNLLCGSREACIEYFRLWKIRLQKYFMYSVDLNSFNCKLVPIENLKSFRYEVAYINRNGFVHNLREIPFSYEWSSGRYYFNPVTKEIPLKRIGEISCREKKALLKCRVTDAYDSLMISKGYVSPWSFCEIEKGEELFNTPHQYFKLLYKSVEEYAEIAGLIGESIYLNDDEMYAVVCKKTAEMFRADSPKLLSANDKIELAKVLHKDYNASNGQIQRMLKLEKTVVESLFPKAV